MKRIKLYLFTIGVPIILFAAGKAMQQTQVLDSFGGYVCLFSFFAVIFGAFVATLLSTARRCPQCGQLLAGEHKELKQKGICVCPKCGTYVSMDRKNK